MTTFAEEIEEMAGDEPIEAAVLSRTRGWSLERDSDPAPLLLKWVEARPLLDYEYAHGFGGVDCHAVHVWTRTKVIVVGTYDGSSWVTYVPRNPAPTPEPDTIGGG